MDESEKYISYKAAKWHLYREFITDKEAAKKAFHALSAIPAADVRPVVLCRDCRRWDTDWTPNHARGNEHFCPVVGLTTRSDWFCADGERREES